MSEIINDGTHTVIKPGVDVVAAMAERFKGDMLTAINASQCGVALDLQGVEKIDAIGVGMIIAAYNTLNQKGRELKIVNATKDIFELFSTMGLNRRIMLECSK
ncbi:MAG: anti-anti-sigma factor [Desulfobacterales bacterium]|nr:MAG: anti-anti-sigma factor [Desulfobacterales bacterium]